MKNYLTNLFNSSFCCHVMRLAMVCIFSFFTVTANASNASETRYRAYFRLHENSTGGGSVYLSVESQDKYNAYVDGQHKGGGEGFRKLGPTDALAKDNKDNRKIAIQHETNGEPITFTNITFEAEPNAGSIFEGWYVAADDKFDESTAILQADAAKVYVRYPSLSLEGNEKKDEYFLARFSLKTYILNSPMVGIITLDATGIPLEQYNLGGKIGCSQGENVQATSGQMLQAGAVKYEQVADGNGETGQATFLPVWYVAEANEGYEFVGWTDDPSTPNTIEKPDSKFAGEPIESTWEKGTDGNVTAKTYYAVFRRKLMGYNQPRQIIIEGEGEISIDGTNWQNGSITHNPTIAYVSSINPKDIGVKYYARNKDGSDYYFLGWYNEQGVEISNDPTYTYSYRPTAEVNEDLKYPPTLIAKFVPTNYYYRNYASVEAIEYTLGQVFVDDGTKATIDAITEGWDSHVEFGNIDEVQNDYQFTYTYYAKPLDGNSAFKSWVTQTTDPETGETIETEVSNNPVFQYTVDYTNKAWQPGEETPFTPPTLYAHFITSRYYYHGRAQVGIADNSEAGKVFVSSTATDGPTWYSPSDVQPYYISNEDVVDYDNDGVTNPDVIETPLNEYRYNYHYYAQPSATAAFVGWTTSSSGDNIIGVEFDKENNNHYMPEYYASDDITAPHMPLPLYAVFRSYYHTLPRVISIGSGKVMVNDKTGFQVEINSTEAIPTPAEGNYYSYTYTLTAQADEGAQFLGWSTSDSEEDIISNSETYTVNGRTTSTNRVTPHRMTMYAIFESDIQIKHTDRMIYYQADGNEYINDVNVILEVANATTLTASLSGNTTDFMLTNANLTEEGTSITVDATQSIIPLRLIYIGKDKPLSNAIGKQATLTFTSYDQDRNPLANNGKVITIEEMPVVTFLPTDGKGSYVVSHTDGSGISYTLNETTDKSVKINVTHESKSYLQLDLTDKAEDGMEFFAWQIIENYGTKDEKISYLSYDKLYTYHFTKSVTIRPEFIPEGWARYIIKSNPDVPYFDLTKAIAQATIGVTSDERIIVVYRDGLLPKGEYTIPSGVTFLVPGEGPGDAFGSTNYLCQTNGALTTNDYIYMSSWDNNAKKAYKCFRKLTIEDGTLLNIADGGTLCVSAKAIVTNPGTSCVSALPLHFGHIELGHNAVINVQNNATLYAWGYITNANDVHVTTNNYHNVGRVTAQSGSTIWETFVFTDFRGGSATVDFVDIGDGNRFLVGLGGLAVDQLKNMNVWGFKHEVFPINQYYVQNIEAPLVLHSGSKERLSTGVNVSGTTTTTPATLVDDASANNGLFQWVSKTAKLIKFYDSTTDLTKYVIEDTQANDNNRKVGVKLGNIGLTLTFNLGISMTVDINSNAYVMPIHSGMELYIKNAKVEMPSGINIAFMQGSTTLVDKNSQLINNAQCYVYDTDQEKFASHHTNGFFGSNDKFICPIHARPYGGYTGTTWTSGVKVMRSSPVNCDASLIVDGTLNSSEGYLITTAGGANITSNGGGKIIVGKFGSASSGSGRNLKRNQSVFQYNQVADNGYGVGYHAILLATKEGGGFYPMLHNSVGDQEYTHATTATTYYYCSGTWGTTSCTENVEYADYTPRFALTAPEISCYVGEGIKPYDLAFQLLNDQLTPENWGTVQWQITFTGRDANLFAFPDEQGEQPTITFNPASEGTKTAVMHIKATYTQDGETYVYAQAIDLVATVRAQIPNTLAFANFSTLYKGQLGVALWTRKNSNGAITIEVTGDGVISTPDAATGLFNALDTGKVTVRVIQAADLDLHIPACTIQTTIQVKPRVVWNWKELYYPSQNTNPITMMDNTIGWTLEEDVDSESGDIVKFEGQGSTAENPNSTYTAEIFDLITGKFKVKFLFRQPGFADEEFESIIYRDPRHLRVDVNNDTIFRGISIGKHENITYNKTSKTVEFASPENENAVWTLYFIGVPDKLHFIPSSKPLNQDKAWQIEESTNGITWTTTMPWQLLKSKQEFEYSLMPSTRYVRISYGVNGTGCLSDLYITELQGVKIDPQKLYMPAAKYAQKHVALTYVSSSNVTINDPNELFTAAPNSLSKTSDREPYYLVEDVVITNDNCMQEELNNINIVSSAGTVQLPIQTYKFPQQLPIVLASDHDERFYYVTTNTYNVQWKKETRAIQFSNAVAATSPFVTFHYYGKPTYISFIQPEGIKGEWIIEESTNGTEWSTSLSSGREVNDGLLKQTVNPNTTYIRVTYSSLYAEHVEITDLQIIGEKGAFASEPELVVNYVSETQNFKDFTITAINLEHGMTIETDNPAFTLTHGTNIANTAEQNWTLNATNYPNYSNIFANGAMEALDFKVYFDGSKAVDYTTITVKSIPGAGETTKVLSTIQVTGVRETLTKEDFNLYTGVPDGTNGVTDEKIDGKTIYTLKGAFVGKEYRPLSIDNAFANGSALFDYLFIFGETTTMDGTTTIVEPTTIAGSNAKTPCYIYKKVDNVYKYHALVENANTSTKITQDFLQLTDEESETVKVYITGFCPYASTGYTKADEGIFFFRGDADDHVHIYLQDCHLFSRAKTEDGHFFENRSDGNSFTENYVQGSGAVLVFECSNKANTGHPFKVTIHTRDNNVLRSHYGCFLESVAGRAFQASPPVQVHMQTADFIKGSFTEVNFDDLWPDNTGNEKRTNGFLSLQKKVNNAPSIDLGNPNTVLNFNGGRIELQNAQIVSDNYATTMAIAYRSGEFAGFPLASGLGADAFSGTVNFYDGTTTVQRMKVDARFQGYYVMDEDDPNTPEDESQYTSCLRVPANTYVFGGSHCKMLTCSSLSAGGYPKGKNAEDEVITLVPYKYPHTPEEGHKGGWSAGENGLVIPKAAPEGYGVASVTPNNNATPDKETDDFLNFWVPEGYDTNAEPPRIEQKLSFWKACMTYIAAQFSVYGGSVGGDVVIETDKNGQQTEKVTNLLYCEIDQSIREVIRDNYSAPVKSPLPEGDPYLYVTPSTVGEQNQHYILNENNYTVDNKIYYITTATADIWTTFTAPFNVEKIYIMETRHEDDLHLDAKAILNAQGNKLTYLDAMKEQQAFHNANFAAFFGVAMVIHPNKTFDQIFADYRGWANDQDKEKGRNRRNMYELKHFYKLYDDDGKESFNNWNKADYYLYKNTGEWELTDAENPEAAAVGKKQYTAQWDFVVPAKNEPLMRKGETYTMLFPYCTGCWDTNEDDEIIERDFWDYWTGKFLIFESTVGPHDVNGSSFVGATASILDDKTIQWTYNDSKGLVKTLSDRGKGTNAILSGNSTFALMGTQNESVWGYKETIGAEGFRPGYVSGDVNPYNLLPTQSFIYMDVAAIPSTNPVIGILRDGSVLYENSNGNNQNTSNLIPTVGGGNDLFITAIEGGINIAVAEPQMVKVMSSTGAVLFAGYITTATDVQLPTHGIYIVSGENEVQKIMH